jgi:hypothetical protein
MYKIHQKQQKIHDLSKTQTTNTMHNNTIYNIVENCTNIQFTQVETMKKALKYNLRHKLKNRLKHYPL